MPKEVKAKTEEKKEKYFYGLGRRKNAVARVRIYPSRKAEKDFVVNGKKMDEYFTTLSLRNIFLSPFKSMGLESDFKVSVLVRGGGVTGQAEASRMGIARALVEFDGELKKSLKSFGFLTRDSRVVERKKPGLKKARRAPQWQKR